MGFKKVQIRAVILAGGGDFGRCPLAGQIPSSLWPGVDGPVLQGLVDSLQRDGICDITICSSEEDRVLEEILKCPAGTKIRYQPETFPLGTAGCIREAAGKDPAEVYLILHANLINPPRFTVLMEEHQRKGADFSVVLNRGEGKATGSSAGIYILNASVVKCIPAKGYCDIKEGLIPHLLTKGRTVHAIELKEKVFLYQDWAGYLQAVLGSLQGAGTFKGLKESTVFIPDSARVEAGVQFVGSVVVQEGAEIGAGSVIAGPAVIGRNSRIGKKTLVDRSVLWADSQIGNECIIQESLVAGGGGVSDRQKIQGTLVVNHLQRSALLDRLTRWKILERIPTQMDKEESTGGGWPKRTLIFLVIALAWAYWPIWKELWRIWQQSDEYSSGMLVPILAGYAIWSRRDTLRVTYLWPTWMGLWILLPAFLLCLAGMYLGMATLERYSLVGAIVGVGWLILGSSMIRKLWGVAVFLILMLPLPRSFEASITLPLQGWATSSAVFCLEILGYAPMREGHMIHIGNTTVAIAEACNGLRMITAFFVISGFVVLILRREWWEKAVLLLTTLPVALLCNTIRLTGTSIAFTIVSGEKWQVLFHDYGGYAMMPLALGAIVGQLWLMRVLIPPEEVGETVS